MAKLLKKLDLNQVWLSIQDTPPHALLLALLATAVSYVALMGYDFGSLRLVGAKVPAKKLLKPLLWPMPWVTAWAWAC